MKGKRLDSPPARGMTEVGIPDQVRNDVGGDSSVNPQNDG